MRRDQRETKRIAEALRALGWRVREGDHIIACNDEGHTITFTARPLRDGNFARIVQRRLRSYGVEIEVEQL